VLAVYLCLAYQHIELINIIREKIASKTCVQMTAVTIIYSCLGINATRPEPPGGGSRNVHTSKSLIDD
jgi:hypothetical protein